MATRDYTVEGAEITPRARTLTFARGRDWAAAMAARQKSLTFGLGLCSAKAGSPRRACNPIAKVTARKARRSWRAPPDTAARSNTPAPFRARSTSLFETASPFCPTCSGRSRVPQTWQSNAHALRQCLSERPQTAQAGQAWNGTCAINRISASDIAAKVMDGTHTGSMRPATEILSTATTSI